MNKKIEEFVIEFLNFDELWSQKCSDYGPEESILAALTELGSKVNPKLNVKQVKTKIRKVEKIYEDELIKMEEAVGRGDVFLSEIPWFPTMFNKLNPRDIITQEKFDVCDSNFESSQIPFEDLQNEKPDVVKDIRQLEFVREYLNINILWNKEHLHHYNQEMRFEAMTELANKFQPRLTVEEVKSRIKKLKLDYNRELTRISKNNRAEINECPEWFNLLHQELTKIKKIIYENYVYVWTNEAVLLLIQQIKEHPLLWLPSDVNYYSETMRQSVYEEIASSFNCRPDEVEQEWHRIFNRFWDEVAKTERPISDSQWFALPYLSFLNETVKNSCKIFTNLCRSCMKEDEELFDVFSNNTSNNDFTLAEAFHYFTGVQILENDEFPKSICQSCLDQIEEFVRFKDQANVVQNSMLELFEQEKKPILERPPFPLVVKRTEVIPFKCPHCEKVLKNNCLLRKHLRNHENPDLRKHLCHVCGMGFKTSSALIVHKLRHTGEKPYACNVCGKKFRQAGNLKAHLLVHGGKSIKCPDCGKCFGQKLELVHHQRVHTGERPFACTECDKKYTKRFALEEHFKVAHRGFKYICELCSKELSCASHLSRHLKLHTNEKPFKCTLCPQDFSRSDYLKKHIAKDHRPGFESLMAEEISI